MFSGISSGDWLQSGASVFGSIIAVGGVYWQVDKQAKKDNENQMKFKKFQDYFKLADEIKSITFEVPNILSFSIDEFDDNADFPFVGKVKMLLFKVKNELVFLNNAYSTSNFDIAIVEDCIKDVEKKINAFAVISFDKENHLLYEMSKFKNNVPSLSYETQYLNAVKKKRDDFIDSIDVLSNLILNYTK